MYLEFDCPGGYYMLGDRVSAARAEAPVPGRWGGTVGSASMYGVSIFQFGGPRRISLEVRFHEDIETSSLGDITPSMENPDPGWGAAEVMRGGLREDGDLAVIVDGQAIAEIAAASGRYGYTLTLRRRAGGGDREEHRIDVYPSREPEDPRPIVPSRDAEVRRSSREELHTEGGYYTLVSGFRWCFEVLPDPAPSLGFGVDVGDRMAWVFTLAENPTAAVYVTVYQADAEPADVLAKLRTTHPHEAEVVVDNDSTGLNAIGGRGDHQPEVAPEGRHRVAVFARRREDKWGHMVEEHILVSWPASARTASSDPNPGAAISSRPSDRHRAPTPESYAPFLEALADTESLSVLVVAGKSRTVVADALHVDFAVEIPEGDSDDLDITGWALAEIPGGVLAIEHTGYGDPSLGMLQELSRDGGAAAVVRNNVMAHQRFGCARDGEVLFDDDEFMYTRHPNNVPTELRGLFDLVYDDLETDETTENSADPFAVGLAMTELITGIHLVAEDIATVQDSGYFAGPAQEYGSER